MAEIKGRYRETPDTLQDKQWSDIRITATGALVVAEEAGAVTSSAKLEDSAHVSGDMGVFILGVRNDAGSSLTSNTGDYSPIAVDSSGALQIIAGSGATSFAKNEDAAHSSGDRGVPVWGVRNDSGSARSDTDGDYTPVAVDAIGRVQISMSAGAFGSAAASITKAEDAVHNSGDTGVMSLGVRNDALATRSDTDGDYTAIALNTNGAVLTAMGALRANGSDAVSNTGVLARVADPAGNPAYLGTVNYVFNGTTWDRIRGDTTGLKIKPNENVFEVTLTTDTSAYADGDLLAETQLVSASFFEASGADRTLTNVVVLDKADQGFGIDLFFLRSNVTFGSENSAPSISDANAAEIVGFVRIAAADWIDVGGARIATITGVSQVLQSTDQNLYIAAVVRGAGTYAGGTDIVVKLGVQ